MSARPEVGDARDGAGYEEQRADGDGDALDGVVGELDEQYANNDGAEGTENGALQYFYHLFRDFWCKDNNFFITLHQ
jgi:hypothetical protein